MAKKKTDLADKAETSTKKKASAATSKKGAGTAKAPAAKAPAAKAAGSKQSKPQPARGGKSTAPAATPTVSPMIDTSLAAQAAASMLLNRQKRETDPGEKKGSLVQQLKQDLSKGHQQTVSGVLDKAAGAGQKRPNLPFGQKQVGHNQTFGPDLTRSGVPRRTSG
jgi:hypothetical protein